MWDEIISAIISIVVTVVGTAITAILIPAATTWLKSRTQNQKLQTVIDDLTVTVQSSVDMLEQTVVAQLKADGKWNKAAQERVLEDAVTEVLNGLNASTYNMIDAENTDIQALVKRHIEAYINSKKSAD